MRLVLVFWTLSNMDSSFSHLEVLNSKDHLVTTVHLFVCSVDIKVYFFIFCLPCISSQILANNQLDALYIYIYIYRVSQEVRAKLREDVPYVKLYRYNPKHLYPKLNGYGVNGQRSLKLWQLLLTY